MYWSYEYTRTAGVKNFIKGDHRIYRRNFCSCEKKAWKHSVLYGIQTLELCDTGAALFLQNVGYLNKPCVHKLMLLCITSHILKAVTSSLPTTPFSYYWCTSSTPRTSSALILANSRFVKKTLRCVTCRIFNSLLGVSSASHAWYILKSSAKCSANK